MNNHTTTALVLAALTVSAAQSVPFLLPSSPRTQAAAVHPSDYVRIAEQDGPYTVPAGKLLVVKQLHLVQSAGTTRAFLFIDGVRVANLIETGENARTGPFQFAPGIVAGEGSVIELSNDQAGSLSIAFGYLVDAN